MIRLDSRFATPFIDEQKLEESTARSIRAEQTLLEKSGAGNDFLGWRDLLLDRTGDLTAELNRVANDVRRNADVLLCIGIGGSYLGAEAVIQALEPRLHRSDNGVEVLFAGHHLGSDYLHRLLAHLEGKSVYVNVISKSGTTLEPAVAFRVVRNWLNERFENASERIIVTTDPARGALHAMHERYGYRKFVIPPDVGGRFSVLTPVGLLPLAAAGIDTESLLQGAIETARSFSGGASNIAIEYAAIRSALYDDGYAIELLASFEPRLTGLQAWWQQLFGESEGKDGEGLYPDAVGYTSDLHSLGQYVQDGQRILLETFLMVEEDDAPLEVPSSEDDSDGLNYLAGKSIHEINRKAHEGTAEAHRDGGVPNMTLWLPRLDANAIGALIYFFEHAVAVSGYALGINPFDQPGVEAYKKNMFRLLGRP